MCKVTITTADAQLLDLLRENARASTASLARRLGVSRTTVQSRIERLEQAGVIAGYTVRLGQAIAQQQVRAHVSITVLPKKMPSVVKALQAIPAVRSLYSVSGVHDLVATVAADGVAAMDELTDAIGALDGVERTTTAIILGTKFER